MCDIALMPLALSGGSAAAGNAFDLRGDSVPAASCACDIRVLPLDLFTSFRSNHSSPGFRLPKASACAVWYYSP
jgi:hypothetical protein